DYLYCPAFANSQSARGKTDHSHRLRRQRPARHTSWHGNDFHTQPKATQLLDCTSSQTHRIEFESSHSGRTDRNTCGFFSDLK
ncbi:hypothetical protein AOLI_G00031560, partial [Acnodon oligacanthus]